MCTSFLAFKSNAFAVTGRSLDYDHDNQYKNTQYPKGQEFNSVLNNGVSWQGQYGIYTIDSVVSDSPYPIPFEGMNEAGLSISGNLANASYPQNESGPTISTDDMVNWVLSQAGSIGEAQSVIEQVNIQSEWQYHYIIFDQLGNSLVVEFANEKAVFYVNASKVLTNNPDLNYQLENQNNYANIKNWFPNAVLPDSGDQFHGQGMLGIPGDWMSTSRFTRVNTMLNFAIDHVQDQPESVDLAKRIIDSASLIKGIDLGAHADGLPIYTQIQIVKDLVNSVCYWRIYGSDWVEHQIQWN